MCGEKKYLISCKLRLEILVHDEVNHRLADAPVRGGHAAPVRHTLKEKAIVVSMLEADKDFAEVYLRINCQLLLSTC